MKNKKSVLRIVAERREVFVGENLVYVPNKEYLILTALHSERRIWTRDELLNKFWGIDKSYDVYTRTIDQHIARLRRRLSGSWDKPRCKTAGRPRTTSQEIIKTVSTSGYMLASGI